MHVGFALLTLFPGRVGGSEANVRGLLAQFRQGTGPERLTILANAEVERHYPPRTGGPVDLHRVRSYRAGHSSATRLAAMASAALVPRAVSRDVPSSIDVMHHPVTVPIPRPRGVPVVSTVYDLQHHDLPHLFSRAERGFRRWAYDGAARNADIVVTTSQFSRGRLIDAAGVAEANVRVIPMGIDLELFNPRPTTADTVVRDLVPERFVVYPGNLWPHKNHARLIQALARARDRDLHLVLTGQDFGKKDALLRQAAECGVGDRVHHLGYLEREQVPALLRLATAMVFPSLYEGFGSPPLEAMACGCPVTASRRASLREMVGEAATELDPESVDSIAGAMDRVSSDEGLRSGLRERGFAWSQRFTWETAAERHLDVYREAQAATSGPRRPS